MKSEAGYPLKNKKAPLGSLFWGVVKGYGKLTDLLMITLLIQPLMFVAERGSLIMA
jgi:hypothetical protein